MKAILLLQTVSISKILDVETDNVATACSSEMRRGGKENSYVEKRLYKAIKLFPIWIKRSTIAPAISATPENPLTGSAAVLKVKFELDRSN